MNGSANPQEFLEIFENIKRQYDAKMVKSAPWPSEEELKKMSAKELKKLITERGKDVSSCFEKSDFLELALKLRG